jgi:hypothetical protein
MLPTAPAPPETSTVNPCTGPSVVRQCQAVSAGTPREAPSSKEAPSGRRTARWAGTTLYSAAVPHWRSRAAMSSHTRSPTRSAATPSPTASITPAPSWLGTAKPHAGAPAVRSDFQSVGLTPDRAICTRTSPGPGSGVSTSVTSSEPESPPVR